VVGANIETAEMNTRLNRNTASPEVEAHLWLGGEESLINLDSHHGWGRDPDVLEYRSRDPFIRKNPRTLRIVLEGD
jgi:hypothetical protein